MVDRMRMNAPGLALANSDATSPVQVDGAKLGELRVSRGAVVWYPANASYGYKLSWRKFGELMVERGRHRVEKR